MRPAGWQQRNWSTGLFATFNCNYTTVKTINTSSYYPPLSLSLSLASSPAGFPSHVSFPTLLSVYICGIKVPYRLWGDVVYGGRGEVVKLTNRLLEKDDLLWLRVPDWSCGVLFIHLRPPAAAAAFTSSCLPVPSLPLPLCPGLSCCLVAGSWPSVAAVIGSTGVEKEAAAPSFSCRVIEGRGRWLKTDIPCCLGH